MPHLLINILSTIFYGSIFSELLRIARCTLRTDDFISRVFGLFSIMIGQGRNKAAISKQLSIAYHRYPAVFQNYGENT